MFVADLAKVCYPFRMAVSDEVARRRRECWDEIMRGAKSIFTGVTQIIAAIAKYQLGMPLSPQ